MELKNQQNGFTLVEILISVVVLSIGLLGLAALQINMIRYNHSAQLRSIAISQANSMIDRMRANYSGVKAGYYNNISGIPSAPSCSTCTSSETATKDANKWNNIIEWIFKAIVLSCMGLILAKVGLK